MRPPSPEDLRRIGRHERVLETGTLLWLVRAGAMAALAWSGEKALTRAWARAIHEAWPDLGGVVAPSAVAGRDVVVLWTTQPFPVAPSFSVPLNHPGIATRIAAAAKLLNVNSNVI